ncbi:hypothetical protein CEP52_013720 [Fusarium oligoseptatum]|uniref:Uncharacterized protein n=1 Tax=Fusarium oligoseptatum TaxID=2604345 RepID=A0A428SS66_9HYPO|nr:hypothetical protein CEP52_013720 [Fusarium oligoseptatum]
MHLPPPIHCPLPILAAPRSNFPRFLDEPRNQAEPAIPQHRKPRGPPSAQPCDTLEFLGTASSIRWRGRGV